MNTASLTASLATDGRPIVTFSEMCGVVNGDPVEGAGASLMMPTFRGTAKGFYVFSQFPRAFNPLGIAISAQCYAHALTSMLESPAVNFTILTKRQGGYTVKRAITYPNGRVLTYIAEVRFQTPTHVTARLEFAGHYGGPLDVVQVLPYESLQRPGGQGKIVAEAEPVLLQSDGTEIKIAWEEETTFTDSTVTLAAAQLHRYDFVVQHWEPTTFTLQLEGLLQSRPVH